MKYLVIWLGLILILTGNSLALEYRNFTNQDGKTIIARIVDIAADGGKVQLELKNRNKAWVELSTLSIEDQTYIKLRQLEMDEEDAAKKKGDPPEELSRKQVTEIAEQYIEALINSDFDKIESMMLVPVDIAGFRMQKRHPVERYLTTRHHIERGKVLKVKGNSAVLELEPFWPGPTVRWLCLTSDGKIKYEPTTSSHPVMLAWLCASNILDEYHREGLVYNEKIQYLNQRLVETGVPLFGFDPNATWGQQDKSLYKIRAWAQDEGMEWDNSEPKIFLHKWPWY